MLMLNKWLSFSWYVLDKGLCLFISIFVLNLDKLRVFSDVSYTLVGFNLILSLLSLLTLLKYLRNTILILFKYPWNLRAICCSQLLNWTHSSTYHLWVRWMTLRRNFHHVCVVVTFILLQLAFAFSAVLFMVG